MKENRDKGRRKGGSTPFGVIYSLMHVNEMRCFVGTCWKYRQVLCYTIDAIREARRKCCSWLVFSTMCVYFCLKDIPWTCVTRAHSNPECIAMWSNGKFASYIVESSFPLSSSSTFSSGTHGLPFQTGKYAIRPSWRVADSRVAKG